MFIGRRFGSRWFAGANIGLIELLIYVAMGGLLLYSIISKVST
jgi:hypothetical protein